MAPTPDNLTHRIWFEYVTGSAAGISRNHRVMFRYAASLDIAAAISAAQTRLQAWHTGIDRSRIRTGWRVLSGFVSRAGTDFSLDFTLAPIVTALDGGYSGAWAIQDEATEYNWQLRSTVSGINHSYSLFGIAAGVGGNFRFSAAEATWVAASCDALYQATHSTPIVAPDGTSTSIKRYVNAKVNDAIVKSVRA